MSLHTVQIIDNLNIGGAEKLLITLAGQAQAYSLEVTIVSLGSNNDRMILDELSRLGTKVIIFPAGHLLDLRRIFRLARFLSSQEFNLVQCHLTYANIIGTLCGRLAGLPVINTLHSIEDVLQGFHPMIGFLETWAMRYWAKRIVAVGYTIRNSFQSRLRGRSIEVIPNAVSIPVKITQAERVKLRKEVAGDPAKTILISVGRFAAAKGYEDLRRLRLQHRQNFVDKTTRQGQESETSPASRFECLHNGYQPDFDVSTWVRVWFFLLLPRQA